MSEQRGHDAGVMTCIGPSSIRDADGQPPSSFQRRGESVTDMATKPLRFAILIRVSTEKQEKRGESLLTQRKQLVAAVKSLGGVLVTCYGDEGHEHATRGWEREQLKRLLQDAGRNPRPFDALMVTDPSRWSRDHVQSEQDLEYLNTKGIRFFTLTTEHDLNSEDARLFLRLSSVINGYAARVAVRKSIENRIERAKRNIPTAGSKPFGRRFDKETGKWSVDKSAQKEMQAIATRLLNGERMVDVARAYQVGEVTLYARLKRAGRKFPQRFKNHMIEIDVPPLLDARTLNALRRQMERNRTYHRQQPKHRYLLGRLVFCEHCGSGLSGQTQHGVRYYRHLSKAHPSYKTDCPFTGFVRAFDLEREVMYKLEQLADDPIALAHAIEEAIPNREEVIANRERLAAIEEEISRVRTARSRILNQIERDTISEQQASKKLTELKLREQKLDDDRGRLELALATVPKKETIERIRRRKITTARERSDRKWKDRRELAESMFDGKTIEGRRLGVYVSRLEGSKAVQYRIVGRFGEATVRDGDAERDAIVTEFSSYPPR